MVDEQFDTGTKVWAKIKGHPWWPAQVADPADLSQLVLNQKPKRPSYYIPVLFYGSNNYGWLQSDSIRHFDDPAVEGNAARKSPALIDAIQRARADDSPDGKLKIFEDDGNSDDGENDEEEAGDDKNEEGEEDDEAESVPASRSSARKPRSTARKTPAKTPASERKSKNGKRKAETDETPSKRKRSSENKSRRDESEESREQDDEEDAEEPRTNKRKASKPKTPAKSKKDGKRLEEQAAEEPEKKKEKTRSDHDQLMYFRHKIQKMMKESPETLASSPKIDGIMSEVESFPMTLNLLKDTKMGKLMKRMSQIKFTEDSYGIKERTHRLMKRWKNDFAEHLEKDAAGSEETESTKKTAEETSSSIEKDEKENHRESPAAKDPISATSTTVSSSHAAAAPASPNKKKEAVSTTTMTLEDSGRNLQKSTLHVGNESGNRSPVKESGNRSPVKESGIRSVVKESNGNLLKQEPAAVASGEEEGLAEKFGANAEENRSSLTAE